MKNGLAFFSGKAHCIPVKPEDLKFGENFMTRYLGIVLILVSAASFGAMAIFGKFVYVSGIPVHSLLFYRFLFAFSVMLPVAVLQKRRFPRGADLGIFILMGLLGYSGQSFCFFSALSMIPAPLTAILLYLYPVIVMALSVFFLNEKLTAQKLIALFLAIAGTILVVGFEAHGNVKGVMFGIGAAIIYSVYTIAGAKVMFRNDVFTATIVVIGSALFFYAIFNIRTGLFVPDRLLTWVNILAIAVICTAVAISTYFYGIQMSGAVNAAMLSTFEPVTTMILAALFLGQTIGRLQVIGALLVIGSAVIVAVGAENGNVPEMMIS